MQRLLLVEDDSILGGGVKAFLEGKGYHVEYVTSLKEATKVLSQSYSLIVLDINLPDGNGIDFCKEIREARKIPIIFLTANDTEKDMIDGFQAGCDDYIAKPFSIELLNQRIMAVLRRSEQGIQNELFQYKNLSVDFHKMQVFLENQLVKLSVTEYKLLELLIKNKGQVLTRTLILEKIWDQDENYVDENTLNVHIRRLRQKIEKDSKNPEYVITVFGIGYTFGE